MSGSMVPLSQPVLISQAGSLGARRKPGLFYYMDCCKCKNLLVESDLYCPICGAPAMKRQIASLKGVLLGIVAFAIIVCLVEFIF
jgi:hypothetical protein